MTTHTRYGAAIRTAEKRAERSGNVWYVWNHGTLFPSWRVMPRPADERDGGWYTYTSVKPTDAEGSA